MLIELQQEMELLRREFRTALSVVGSTTDLESLRTRYLGRKGVVQELMQRLRDCSKEERPHAGKFVNDCKEVIERELTATHARLMEEEQRRQLASETLDTTLPGRQRRRGVAHVVYQVLDEMLSIMRSMGFSLQTGPEIDNDYYNFEALNMGPNHPARAMQDTFYIDEKTVLRTQTTNVEIRVMEGQKPPIRVVSPGKVFRNEDVSARSHVFFHQIEAIYIDRHVSIGDLLATIELFVQRLFGKELPTRIRASYFPYVEPGMEADLLCFRCQGTGCSLCKQSGWLEIGGAGMLHPEVLKNGGIDPSQFSGFAWGLGVERMVLLKHGIGDIRLFTENDLRFLGQF